MEEKLVKSQKRKPLGKGLNSLLGLNDDIRINEHNSATPVSNRVASESVIYISPDKIKRNPYQPRFHFEQEELQSLANSIKVDGIVQPLIVTKNDKNEFILIAGERRWRASRIVGLKEVPVIVKSVTPNESLRIAIIENVQRADLNVIEEGKAYQTLINDFEITHDECAIQVGKDRSTVTNLIRMLSLPQTVQQHLLEKNISMGHGRALLSLEDEELISKACDIVVSKSLTVRQTESLVRKLKKSGSFDLNKASSGKRDNNLEYIAETLRGHFNTKVKLSGTGQRGKIEISYFTADELERILQNMTDGSMF